MNFSVAQLLEEGVGAKRNYAIDQPIFPTQSQIVKGGVRLLRTHKSTSVHDELESWVYICCSRCLKEYQKRIVFPLQEEYLSTTHSTTKSESLDIQTEDGIFTISSDHILSLEEAIRQYIITCSPMKPLCREDCPGLCISCRTNLTQSQCTCTTNADDLHWMPLISQLKED